MTDRRSYPRRGRTRAEFDAVLESEPLTCNQLGALHREAGRLGLTDRQYRLAVASDLLGLDGLGSFTELRQGEAGRLVCLLMGIRDRAGLRAAIAGRDQPDVPVSAVPAAKVLAFLFLAWREPRGPAGEADLRQEFARFVSLTRVRTRED